jgi:glycosyltransferase involved in cell wall biosynthesis
MVEIVSARPEWQFVCIGTKRIDLSELEARSNFTWFPAVSYQELPRIASAFDVAIIPYVVNEHTQTANPLKLREYIATGKPVVTTPMSEVMKFEGYIRTAETGRDFIAAIEAGLDDTREPEKSWEALSGETWIEKAELFSNWIEQTLESRG